MTLRLTLIGGPTTLIEIDGLRLITDPTFSPVGAYASGTITLHKVNGPAVERARIGPLDAVLLSHDQHADNLDPDGRSLLGEVPVTFTTPVGAQRLGARARGLVPWESVRLRDRIEITATPARHGPSGIEPIAGDVTGFVLTTSDGDALYFTGDTVYYDGVEEVSRRFDPRVVIVCAGAARTRGPFDLTMNANDVLDTASAFPRALVVPVHTEGWTHFTESADVLEKAFEVLGRSGRLVRLSHGVATDV